MRVQRKHDIVQAKLRKERQQGKGGTPGAADPNSKAPLPVGKAGGMKPQPKGEKKIQKSWPTFLRAGRYDRRNLGGGTSTRRRTPMTIKAGGGNSKGKGGRGKNIKYKTKWGYGGAYSSRAEWCEVFGFNRYQCLPELHELRTV